MNLKMEVTGSSETLLPVCKTTQDTSPRKPRTSHGDPLRGPPHTSAKLLNTENGGGRLLRNIDDD
jgi:hypothetical protein